MWQRLHLWATTQGLAVQPLNQPSERADRETQLGLEPKFGDALKELIGGPGLQALMPFRVGYPLTDAGEPPARCEVGAGLSVSSGRYWLPGGRAGGHPVAGGRVTWRPSS